MANRDDRPDMTRIIEALLCSPQTGQAVARTLMSQHSHTQTRRASGHATGADETRAQARMTAGGGSAASPWLRTH